MGLPPENQGYVGSVRRKSKPVRRLFHGPIAVLAAKINRLRIHVDENESDKQGADRLKELKALDELGKRNLSKGKEGSP